MHGIHGYLNKTKRVLCIGVLVFLSGCQPNHPLLYKLLPQLDALPDEKLTGSTTIINLWASWCLPCQKELPALENLSRKYKIPLLLINFDLNGKSAQQFLKEFSITSPNYYDPQQITLEQLQLKGVPSTVVVNTKNEIIAIFEGYNEDTIAKIKKVVLATD